MLNLFKRPSSIDRKLQELLKMTFEAEKIYFEVANRVQIAEFSRFLYHQSSNRNKLCNKLIVVYKDNGYEPEMTYTEKFDRSISGLEIKKMLEDKEYVGHVKKCLDFDLQLIEKCNEVLKLRKLPVAILEVITKEMSFLTFNEIKAKELLEKYDNDKVQHPHTRIIKLHSLYS